MSPGRYIKHGLTNYPVSPNSISHPLNLDHIFVSFGGSAYANACLTTFIDLVRSVDTAFTFVLDQSYLNLDLPHMPSNIIFSPFPYYQSLNHYSKFIIRPGLGVLNDLLPMLQHSSMTIILCYEPNNSEMAENADKLFELGVCDAHNILNDPSSFESRLNQRPTSRGRSFDCHGLYQMSNYIDYLIS